MNTDRIKMSDISELEKSFRKQVEIDRDVYPDTVYVPTMMPKSKVDYVFVGMEPALKSWAKDSLDAEKQIASGFRDFMFSRMDFILHYCIRRYLCNDGSTYYITNLSKGALDMGQAQLYRPKRYQNWYSLFIKEFKLVAKSTAKIVAIGKDVKTFLEGSNPNHSPSYILHYSNQAAKWREKYIEGKHSEFNAFKKYDSPKMQDILLEAEKLMRENQIPDVLLSTTVNRLRKGHNLTDSQLKLIFGYKNEFNKLKIS